MKVTSVGNLSLNAADRQSGGGGGVGGVGWPTVWSGRKHE